LHLVPFGVLDDPSGEGPLLARREVVSTPSASALARLRPRRAAAPADPHPPGSPGPKGPTDRGRVLAVVADPVFGLEDERLGGSEPLAGASASSEPLPDGEGTSRLGRLPFGRLPFSAQEAEVVLARAPASARRSLQGFEARKDRILEGALEGYRILHFATHGLASSEHPELSALVLSRLDPEGRPRDGFLWAHEIAGLRLSAELAVLSACDSGLGVPLRGEGLVGLPHAFFQAGVPRMVVSLWPVDDRAAVELMARFYDGYLGRGLDAGEALRRARLSLLRDPRWSRPYYWAGFTLQGAG
ncbi:MAG: CHAT domain-containing protein, partial [Thermoanaerobaculia bacterium]